MRISRNPSIEELHNSKGYELIEVLDYRSMLGFIKRNLDTKTTVMKVFYAILFLTGVGYGALSVVMIEEKMAGILLLLGLTVSIFILSMLPIIPIHELLHGLAFKCMGAGKLFFGANLKEFVVYVTVDRFVLNKKQFYFLALTPFIVLSMVFLGFLCVNDLFTKWVGLVLLAFHTSCCIGDFALMAYFAKFGKNEEVFSYDDVATKTSYFFKKVRGELNFPE
jgi:hypothetical protein